MAIHEAASAALAQLAMIHGPVPPPTYPVEQTQAAEEVLLAGEVALAPHGMGVAVPAGA